MTSPVKISGIGEWYDQAAAYIHDDDSRAIIGVIGLAGNPADMVAMCISESPDDGVDVVFEPSNSHAGRAFARLIVAIVESEDDTFNPTDCSEPLSVEYCSAGVDADGNFAGFAVGTDGRVYGIADINGTCTIISCGTTGRACCYVFNLHCTCIRCGSRDCANEYRDARIAYEAVAALKDKEK